MIVDRRLKATGAVVGALLLMMAGAASTPVSAEDPPASDAVPISELAQEVAGMLKAVDEIILELEEAVALNPDDTQLAETLQSYRDQKAGLEAAEDRLEALVKDAEPPEPEETQ